MVRQSGRGGTQYYYSLFSKIGLWHCIHQCRNFTVSFGLGGFCTHGENKGALTWDEYSAPSKLRIWFFHFHFLMLTLIRKFPTLTWVENAAPSQVRKGDVEKGSRDTRCYKVDEVQVKSQHVARAKSTNCKIEKIPFKYVTTRYHYIIWLTIMI